MPLLHSLHSETCPVVNGYTDLSSSQTLSCNDLGSPFLTTFTISESLDNFKQSSNSHSLENYMRTLIKIHFGLVSHDILENPGSSYSLIHPTTIFLKVTSPDATDAILNNSSHIFILDNNFSFAKKHSNNVSLKH